MLYTPKNVCWVSISLPKKGGSHYLGLCKLDPCYNYRASFIRVNIGFSRSSVIMLLHPLLTVKSFTVSRVSVQFLVFVYNPNMAAKCTALTKSSGTHRAGVRLLTIVYTPYVYNEMSFP